MKRNLLRVLFVNDHFYKRVYKLFVFKYAIPYSYLNNMYFILRLPVFLKTFNIYLLL